MSDVLRNLLHVLKLEQIEVNLFRGQSQDLGFGRVYGGQVIGQALSAAKQTVEQGRHVHSFHSYFLREGDCNLPIIYEVDCIRDGRSFNTRRVVAIQKGRAIFNMSASFQVQEPGLDHQDKMPNVPGPEGLESDLERAQRFKAHIPVEAHDKLLCDRPIEMRVVDPVDLRNPKSAGNTKQVWLKADGEMPDDPRIHNYLLAYASDFKFITTSLRPHGKSFWDPKLQIASLDHAMWFHRSFKMDDWLLYSMDSPSASGARGLVRGQVFDRQGRLVASTIQEGLIRDHS
ncbi:acyl-CoA thioesterase II [Endozoicomonadaceae bacterium StTr2]